MQIHSIKDVFDFAFNPFTPRFKSKKIYKYVLNTDEKIKVIVGTIFAAILTCGIGALAAYRYLVSVYQANKPKAVPANLPLEQHISSLINDAKYQVNYNEIKYYSKDQVFNLLSSLFGETAVTSALEMYKVSRKKKISSSMVHALLTGVIANLTKQDIDFLVKNYEHTCLKPIIGNALQRASSQCSPDTREFEAFKILEVLNALQAIPTLTSNPANLIVNPQIRKEMERLGCENQFAKDVKFLLACKSLNNFNVSPDKGTHELKKFSYAEYLAHEIIYGLEAKGENASFRGGTLVPLRIFSKEEGKSQLLIMEAHRLISKDGLHAVVLLPLDRQNYPEDQAIPVQIIFRGTQSRSAWNRNFNILEKQQWRGWEGPGGASFKRNYPEIFNHLTETLSLIPPGKRIKLEISGHSLGASDSQRMLAMLTSSLVESSISHPVYRNIEEVNLYCFNAPGVEDSMNLQFLENIKKLDHIKFQLRYFKVANDPIQTAANQLLGFISIPENYIENLFVSVFKIGKPQIRFLFKQYNAHTEHFLCNNIHYNTTEKKENDAWIEFIKTNNPSDANLHQQGTREYELLTRIIFKPSSVFKELNNRGIWKKSASAWFSLRRSEGITMQAYAVKDWVTSSVRETFLKKTIYVNH